MKGGKNRRLANVKTRSETGLSYVIGVLNVQTPFGMKALDQFRPFFPGQEEELRAELLKVETMLAFVKDDPKGLSEAECSFMCMKDITGSFERSSNDVLSVVELFEIKSMLLEMEKLEKIRENSPVNFPEDFALNDMTPLLDRLDPRNERLNTFYIYDDFSDKLRELRKKRHDLERDVKKARKKRKKEIEEEYGIKLTPKFDIMIPRSSDQVKKADAVHDLKKISEDYTTITYELTDAEEIYKLASEIDALTADIEEEEFAVQAELSKKVADFSDRAVDNCNRIGQMELAIQKAVYAEKHDCVRPDVIDEHVIEIVDGRQVQVEDRLNRSGGKYCPVSIKLSDGVTCITGANMGGKTISLKLCALVALLTQYAFFVPCAEARVGLSSYIQALIGDSQSVERGLSGFGSEMEELKDMLDHGADRAMFMIDEIASGTNPVEGLALTKSFIDYFKKKPYITLITTHFDALMHDENVRNMQVRGLTGADFRKLDGELRSANRREKIEIISRYMDYRLYEVHENAEIPKDALNIAKMLGLNSEIIEGAKKYIK